MNKIVYLDNNGTTKVDAKVVEAMLPFYSDYYANPSSMYAFATTASQPLAQARKAVAKLINAQYDDEIIFTSCGTESDNAAIFGVLKAKPQKKHFITTTVEHPAIYNLCDELERTGYRVTKLPVNDQVQINLDDLEAAICEDTVLISIMWANNETGTILPIKAAAKIAHKHSIPFHTDAVQAVGKIKVDVQDADIDLLSMSGHKIHAPKGIGVLYCKRGTRLRPFFVGGHQEHGRRAGTENIPAIVGLGKACELAGECLEMEENRIKTLRDKLENELLSKISKTRLNGDKINRTPNTTSITFEYIEGESMLLLLSDAGICASSGSACTSGSLEASHVLIAAGTPPGLAHSALRFSLSRFTTEAEIDYVIKTLPPIIEKLRLMSPFHD